jgi:hypothetical protein
MIEDTTSGIKRSITVKATETHLRRRQRKQLKTLSQEDRRSQGRHY